MFNPFRLVLILVLASAALLAACDDGNGDEDDPFAPGTGTPSTNGTASPTATADDGSPTASPTATPATGQAGAEAEERTVEVTITESDIQAQPATIAAHDDLTLHILNESDIERDVLVIRLGEGEDAGGLFGTGGDEALDRAGLDVVEEIDGLEAMGEEELSVGLEEGQYVILTVDADGMELLYAELEVTAAEDDEDDDDNGTASPTATPSGSS